MSDVVVELDHVDKLYRLGAERMNLRSALPGRMGRSVPEDGHAALRDLSLAVGRGESVGIIGRNGAGKSTILKLVARVVAPSRGRVTTRGVVASLIELGAGFHPDLTGRDNVRFAAVLLGMTSDEMNRRYDEIVAFAGIERFMETPVKRYSSGMLARLGFSVAAHIDADILAVDEVLSVGDSDFQRQCHERVAELRSGGCAILFVTHNHWVVPQVCQRVVWVQEGSIFDEGEPEAVLARYQASSVALERSAGNDTTAAVFESVSVAPEAIESGQHLVVEVVVDVIEGVENARIMLAVLTDTGVLCGGLDVPGSDGVLGTPGRHRLRGHLAQLLLQPGRYRVWLGLLEDAAGTVFHTEASKDFVVIGPSVSRVTYGFARFPSEWTVDEAPAVGGDR